MLVAGITALTVAFWIALVIWTLRDIRSRTRDFFAWLLAGLLVLILGPIGLLLYLLLRPKHSLAEVYDRQLEEEALLQAIEHGANELIVVGALGKRWDQTLANLLLPAGQAFESASIRLVDSDQEIQLLQPGIWHELHGQPGDTLSLVPLLGSACGIRTQGLEYPLNDENLDFGSTRGVSNVLLESSARIYLRQGLLLCILIHGSPD